MISPAIEPAVAVLEGPQRQDDTTAQLQDVRFLAESAGCAMFVLLMRTTWLSLLDEPSGRDSKIAHAADVLREIPRTTEPDAGSRIPDSDQPQVVRRLALAAGCYDADDALRHRGLYVRL